MSFLPSWQGWIESHINFIPRETAAFCGDLAGVEMLDIGGGDMIADIGLLTLGIKHITTLDVLERDWDIVEHAATEVRKAGFPVADDYASRLKYLTYDGARFPFPDNQFDFVYSWSAFEHIPDVPAVLREARRVVKPLGRLFIQVYPWFHSLAGSHLSDFIQEPFFHLRRPREWVRARLDEFVAAHPEQRDLVLGTMWPEYCRLNGYSARTFLSAALDAGFCVERAQSTIDEEHVSTAPPDVALADIVTSGSMVLLRPGKPLTQDELQIVKLRGQLKQAQAEARDLQFNLAAERSVRTGIEHSVSWRVTEPARRFMTIIRGLRR
jgi:SAM-dependent methyltransferase